MVKKKEKSNNAKTQTMQITTLQNQNQSLISPKHASHELSLVDQPRESFVEYFHCQKILPERETNEGVEEEVMEEEQVHGLKTLAQDLFALIVVLRREYEVASHIVEQYRISCNQDPSSALESMG